MHSPSLAQSSHLSNNFLIDWPLTNEWETINTPRGITNNNFMIEGLLIDRTIGNLKMDLMNQY
jgi:hypothetical protein